jgi:hypothetical protein
MADICLLDQGQVQTLGNTGYLRQTVTNADTLIAQFGAGILKGVIARFFKIYEKEDISRTLLVAKQ